MSTLKILHTADLHLDSAFEALPAGKAQLRRTEQRELLARLATLAREEQVQLILLAGDLLDSDTSYYETGEELCRCLGIAVDKVPSYLPQAGAVRVETQAPLPRGAVEQFKEETGLALIRR